MKLVGIIPAAGKATRLSLPFSKELYSLVFPRLETTGKIEYKSLPVISFLINRMKLAGVKKIFLIINKEKFDILHYLGSGKDLNIEVSYLVQESPTGMPVALSLAYNWSEPDTTYVFGMPDTIFYPREALKILLDNHNMYKNEVTLGVFPTKNPSKYGMVEFNKHMNLTNVIDKPKVSNLHFMWGCACWNTSFMQFMVEYIKVNDVNGELVLSDVFKSAIQKNISIKVTPFYNGEYYDIGTIGDLFATTERLKQNPSEAE